MYRVYELLFVAAQKVPELPLQQVVPLRVATEATEAGHWPSGTNKQVKFEHDGAFTHF